MSAAGGGVVYAPAGIYNIGMSLTLPQNVTLQGDGTLSTNFKAVGAIDILTITAAAQTNQFIAVRDIRLNWNGLSTRALNLKNSVFCKFDRVYFNGSVTEAALVTSTAGQSSYHIQFNHCFFGSSGGIGLHVSGVYATGIVLIDCESATGLVADSTNGYNISTFGSIFEGCPGAGIRLEGSSTVGAALVFSSTDAYFESNTTADVDINPSGATASFPNVSMKGGLSYGTTRGIRMNAKTASLSVIGLISTNHATADIDLGDLSTTSARIYIPRDGNSLTSATPILSTNPANVSGGYPATQVDIPLRLVAATGLTTTSSAYATQGYALFPGTYKFPPSAVYTLVAILGVSNVATTCNFRVASDGAGTVYGTVTSNATGRNLVTAALSSLPTGETVIQQDLQSTDNVNTATEYAAYIRVSW
jgi:hypothetical protein